MYVYWLPLGLVNNYYYKPRDTSAIVARGCNCEFAALSRYISETVQANAKVTVEYEVICDLQWCHFQ